MCVRFLVRDHFVDSLEKRRVLEEKTATAAEETAGRVAAAVFSHVDTPTPRRPPAGRQLLSQTHTCSFLRR